MNGGIMKLSVDYCEQLRFCAYVIAIGICFIHCLLLIMQVTYDDDVSDDDDDDDDDEDDDDDDDKNNDNNSKWSYWEKKA